MNATRPDLLSSGQTRASDQHQLGSEAPERDGCVQNEHEHTRNPRDDIGDITRNESEGDDASENGTRPNRLAALATKLGLDMGTLIMMLK